MVESVKPRTAVLLLTLFNDLIFSYITFFLCYTSPYIIYPRVYCILYAIFWYAPSFEKEEEKKKVIIDGHNLEIIILD